MAEGVRPGFVMGVGHDVTSYSPACTHRRHAMGFRSCDAFGDGGIPLTSWVDEVDHTRPHPEIDPSRTSDE